MSSGARILADSVGPHGTRLTTFEATFPRILLAEVNTHRMLSRNSASSRAIPTEKQIEKVRTDPFVPTFNTRVKGMGVGDELEAEAQAEAQAIWLDQAEAACEAAEALLHVDKSRANRLLEPFSHHKAIITGTEWWNFFNLRAHEGAQPEMQALAHAMKDLYLENEPARLYPGDWHLPLVFHDDYSWARLHYGDETEALPQVSAGRCARVSYDTHNNAEAPGDSFGRWEGLWPRAHWSPGEHPAQCLADPIRVNNYVGWKQLRAFYPNEAIFEG